MNPFKIFCEYRLANLKHEAQPIIVFNSYYDCILIDFSIFNWSIELNFLNPNLIYSQTSNPVKKLGPNVFLQWKIKNALRLINTHTQLLYMFK